MSTATTKSMDPGTRPPYVPTPSTQAQCDATVEYFALCEALEKARTRCVDPTQVLNFRHIWKLTFDLYQDFI